MGYKYLATNNTKNVEHRLRQIFYRDLLPYNLLSNFTLHNQNLLAFPPCLNVYMEDYEDEKNDITWSFVK